MSVRETSADWAKGLEPQDDPALKGKKDPDNGTYEIKVLRRNVGKSSGSLIDPPLDMACQLQCVLTVPD